MLNEDLKEDLNIMEKKIKDCLEDMEIVCELIVKTNAEITRIENELQLCEFFRIFQKIFRDRPFVKNF